MAGCTAGNECVHYCYTWRCTANIRESNFCACWRQEEISKKRVGRIVVFAYIEEVYNHFGGSRKILSDNGTEFKNQLFKTVAEELEIDYKVYSPPYHPPSNGRIEGFHSFLKACLSKHIKDPMEWDEIVPFVCSVYNALPNEHSREAPFFLMFGRDPRLPLNDFLRPKL